MEAKKAYILPHGCFSRTYLGKDGALRTVAYHTPTQSVAMLEGDSANVWQRIFDDQGNTHRALAYITENGQFEGDPAVEAQTVLNTFVESLRDANLLADRSLDVSAQSRPIVPTSRLRNTANAADDTETAIAEFMADNRIFYSLALELTYRCNERCVHCYCPENRETGELTATQISALLDEFQSMGGMSLLITGGEVFARKDIKPILRDLRQRNILVSVISNLTMADAEGLELLANLNPLSVGCSVYSAEPRIHDSVTRISGSWKRSMTAIRALKERGVPVILKAPLMENNVLGWRGINALADKMGCEVQFDVNITPKNDGGQSPIDLRIRDQGILKDIFKSQFDRLYMKNEPMTIAPVDQRPQAILCGAGATGLTVAPDGAVRACLGLMGTLGMWPQQSLREIWERSPFFAEWASKRLTDIEKCCTCQHFSFCNRCPGSWQLETGSVMQPADYTCYLARLWSGCSEESTQC